MKGNQKIQKTYDFGTMGRNSQKQHQNKTLFFWLPFMVFSSLGTKTMEGNGELLPIVPKSQVFWFFWLPFIQNFVFFVGFFFWLPSMGFGQGCAKTMKGNQKSKFSWGLESGSSSVNKLSDTNPRSNQYDLVRVEWKGLHRELNVEIAGTLHGKLWFCGYPSWFSYRFLFESQLKMKGHWSGAALDRVWLICI